MPKRIQPLTDMQINKAKPKAAQYPIFDGFGLFLMITPTGGKLWRFKYTLNGKPNTLSFGPYPEVSLATARDKRQEAREMLAKGIDPSQARKAVQESRAEAEANCFEPIAREWHREYRGQWSDGYAETVLERMERDLFPALGGRPIIDIEPPELLAVIRRIKDRGALDMAHRMLGVCGKVFRYAIATARAKRDPAADLRGALPPVRGGHYAAITEPDALGDFLRITSGYSGTVVVHSAMRLLPMLLVRPGVLRMMEWGEVDLDAALWKIPGPKMKMKEPLLVPLPRQAVAILRELYPYTRHSRYVFPSARSPLRCMSDNAINAGFRRLGLEKSEVCAHGFRATARTILDEVHEYRVDWIEHQLAHKVKDANGRAYNRTKYLEQRRQMLQFWADYLDRLKG